MNRLKMIMKALLFLGDINIIQECILCYFTVLVSSYFSLMHILPANVLRDVCVVGLVITVVVSLRKDFM